MGWQERLRKHVGARWDGWRSRGNDDIDNEEVEDGMQGY